jgi:hypothetical protein
MGKALVRNNAFSTLATSVSEVSTSVTVEAGQGARFPVVAEGSGDYFYATLINVSNQFEVVKVVATATDVFTVTRGQDGTTARSYSSSDRIELRPTAALFNDKVSVGGGVMTGFIEPPAGAEGSQAPRMSEVVAIAGDTMTGPLSVPELQGPANEIVVPDGHRIAGETAGTLVAPGMVVQTFDKYVTSKVSYSAAVGATVEVEVFTLQFTPKYATSKVLIMAMISGEATESNFTWRLKRDADFIALPGTSRWQGWANGEYDANVTTTPQSNTYLFMDSPATTSEVEYQFHVAPSGASAMTFRTNRSAGSSGADDNEATITQIVVQEIAQ